MTPLGTGRTVIGGVTGGISAAIYGGRFEKGFVYGAKTAAIGFLFNDSAHRVWDWGFGGIIGPLNVEWISSQPLETQISWVTDAQIGGGFKFCLYNSWADNVRKLPFDLNVGMGRYTGITSNNEKLCVNIGISKGLTPVSVSIPGSN